MHVPRLILLARHFAFGDQAQVGVEEALDVAVEHR
jgi:hypothetical protein